MKCYTIESIEECGEEEAWDITMTGDDSFYQNEPNFIAQDILVHNSHAAGIVISPVPLEQICPLHITHGAADEQDRSKKTVATQYSMEDVESLGLIKFDVLGLSTKTALALAVKLIKENHGVDVDLSRLPLKDKQTLTLLTKGDTDGCFQAEKTGMKQAFRQIGIDSFDDLIIAIAMYRPGPKDYIPELSNRKKQPSSVKYVHPVIEKFTKRTQGIIAYQEQAMQIFVALANLTASDGYMFIKGSAKKKPELFQSMKDRFIKGATLKANKKVAEEVWSQMEPFQGYAFNKSLHFSEKVATSEKDISIQELYNRKRRGDNLPCVYSPEGELLKIVDVYDHGVIPVWEVRFSDGSKHKCTLNHKFMTDHGVFPLHKIVEYNLFVVQNWRTGNAKKEGLDLSGMSESPLDSKRIRTSQERMRKVQLKQKEFCLSRLQPEIHQKRSLHSQEEMSAMAKFEITTLFGIKWKNVKKILERNQKRFREVISVQRKDVKSSLISNSIQRKRNSTQDIFSIRYSASKGKSFGKVERRQSETFPKYRQKTNGTECLAFSGREISEATFRTNRFQIQSVGFQQRVQHENPPSSNRFFGQRSKGNCGIRWGSSLQRWLGERLERPTSERFGIRFCYDSEGISYDQDILRYMDIGQEEKIQNQTARATSANCCLLFGSRYCEKNWQKVRITGIQYVGLEQCYDLEVDSDDHLYCLSSGIVSSNSHATSYAYECWKTAYLKAYYMLEFMSARMSVEALRRDFEFVQKCEEDLQRHGYKILSPDINRSKLHYVKVGETELLRPLIIKDVGEKAAHEIIENQPYKGHDLMYAFASKVSSIVNSKVVEALCDAKLFGTEKKKSQLLRDFDTIKVDRKRSCGRQKGNLFAT